MTDPAPVRAVLVTGAAGLVGSHVCEAFAQAGWEVRALDRPGSDCTAARAAGAATHGVELAQPEGALLAAQLAKGAKLVAHAAFPGGDEREEALASVRGAMAAALQGRAPFLLLSSTTVYGRPRNLPCEEGEVKLPVDKHGEVRWAVEREAYLWRRTRGLKLVVLRPALTYGPRQRRARRPRRTFPVGAAPRTGGAHRPCAGRGTGRGAGGHRGRGPGRPRLQRRG